jgi:hypothetical protein
MIFVSLLFFVIPGRAQREPGIHNHQRGLWIPGLRAFARIPE